MFATEVPQDTCGEEDKVQMERLLTLISGRGYKRQVSRRRKMARFVSHEQIKYVSLHSWMVCKGHISVNIEVLSATTVVTVN